MTETHTYLGRRKAARLVKNDHPWSEGHAAEVDIYHTCNTLATQCEAHAEKLGPFADRYGEDAPTEPDRLYHELFEETRSGGLGLLRDLHDLYVISTLS